MTNEQTPITADVTPPVAPPTPPPPDGPKLVFIGVTLGVALVTLIIGVLIGPLIQKNLHRTTNAESKDASSGTWYISQMHPWIIQPQPGSCPICGMDLVAVSPDRFTGEIAIDPVIVQNMGVRIAPAEFGTIMRSLRTVGTVQVDESLVTDVVQRFGGYIEKVFITALWDKVEADSPLFQIYSPQVFAAEEEYLIARAGKDSKTGAELLAAADKKLALLGIPASEIERLKKEGTAASSIVVKSPVTGYVWQKNINEGSEISSKTVAYRLADLSSVWIEATLYEDQLPFISAEQPARIRLNYGDEETFTGAVSYIYPAVDARTREVRARFTFPNRLTSTGPRLRPGMFATIFIDNESDHEYVIIPSEAVIGTGDRHVVFVSLGRGKFSPRNVQLGPRGNNGLIGIRAGIEQGEQVVTSGQFLLDSESKMREALAKIMKGDLASEQMPVGKKMAAVELAELDPATTAAWRLLLERYLVLHNDLYENKGQTLVAHTNTVTVAINNFIAAGKKNDAHFHHRFEAVATLEEQAKALDSSSLEKLRPGFGAISVTIDQLLKQFGQPQELAQPVVGMHCTMAKGIPEKGLWLQAGATIKNPYYGVSSDMRDCMATSWQLPTIGATGGTSAPSEKTNAIPAPVTPIITPPPVDKPPQHEPPATTTPAPTTQHKGATTTPLTADIINKYYELQQALYKNDMPLAKSSAEKLQHGFHALGKTWLTSMQQAAAISTSNDLLSMRKIFAEIGITFKSNLEKNGLHHDGVMVFRCGMARDFADKGVWIQLGEKEPRNPYFGSEHTMAECARETWTVGHNGLQAVE